MDFQVISEFFDKLDRSHFIGSDYKELACLDRPLPIGHGQTISQPSLVLEMTYVLSPDKDCKVLEIGTGSGYQTALLAEFSGRVCTIERVPELAESAKRKLAALGYTNILYRTGDGSAGWPEEAPFERIITTAAAMKLPQDLVDQLKPGGRMIAPVGSQVMQELMLIFKDGKGHVKAESLGEVLFVEFKGKYGWSRE